MLRVIDNLIRSMRFYRGYAYVRAIESLNYACIDPEVAEYVETRVDKDSIANNLRWNLFSLSMDHGFMTDIFHCFRRSKETDLTNLFAIAAECLYRRSHDNAEFTRAHRMFKMIHSHSIPEDMPLYINISAKSFDVFSSKEKTKSRVRDFYLKDMDAPIELFKRMTPTLERIPRNAIHLSLAIEENVPHIYRQFQLGELFGRAVIEAKSTRELIEGCLGLSRITHKFGEKPITQGIIPHLMPIRARVLAIKEFSKKHISMLEQYYSKFGKHDIFGLYDRFYLLSDVSLRRDLAARYTEALGYDILSPQSVPKPKPDLNHGWKP